MPSASSSRAWDALEPPLSEWIVDAVDSMGFSRMTPVQASTIPLFMGNKDVVVEAVTGSGKTLAFLIPLVERLLKLDEPNKKHHANAIVISPTRELATQIETVLKGLIAFHPASAAAMKADEAEESEAEPSVPAEVADYASLPRIVSQLLIGGNVAPSADLQSFLARSPNILIGTPGRLVELLSSPKVKTAQSSFEALVLDEADRLLDLGFKDDLQRIIGVLPKQRRTGLFSASVSEAVDQLIRVGLRNPVRIAVKVKGASGKHDQRTPASLQMRFAIAPASHKLPLILKILQQVQPKPLRTIIYMSTCAAVDYFQHVVPPLLEGFRLVPLHGKHPPNVREKNFAAFTNSVVPSVLLTTDVAARGLDIPQVDLVIQYDPPSDPKAFLHRCGRAGRAGRKGLAVVLLQPGREEDYIRFLEVRQTPVKPLNMQGLDVAQQEADDMASKIRDTVRLDRTWHDKAQRGFVSWVQAYRKHQAGSIFVVGDIDWTDLASAWGLLKMPRMPELKTWDGEHSLGLNVDFSTFAYADKQREKQRKLEAQGNGTRSANQPEEEGKGQSAKRAWSEKLDQRAERDKRRDKKKSKREHERVSKLTDAEKEQEAEVERLIEAAKQQRLQEQKDTFEGFSD